MANQNRWDGDVKGKEMNLGMLLCYGKIQKRFPERVCSRKR